MAVEFVEGILLFALMASIGASLFSAIMLRPSPPGAVREFLTRMLRWANNFFNGTDAELYSGSNAFAAKITASPTSYGLVAGQATSYGTLNTTFATNYLAAIDPTTRTKAKVEAKNVAKAALKANAQALARIIQATPSVTNEQKLDLGVNVRATPSPVGPPGTPFKLVVTLNPDGSLAMTWKCNNPASGVIYNIYRSLDAADPVFIGGSGKRQFIDATVPAGTATIQYQIQAVRTTATGVPGEFIVKLGVTSSGGGTVSVEEKTAPETRGVSGDKTRIEGWKAEG